MIGLEAMTTCFIQALITRHQEKSFYFSDILKTYRRQTKLYVFSRDTNMRELKIKHDAPLQRLHFAMAAPCQGMTSHCNGFVGIKKAEEKKKKENE